MPRAPRDIHTRTAAHARPYIASGTKYVLTPTATGKGHHVHYPTSPQEHAATHVFFTPTPNGLGVHARFIYPDDDDRSAEGSRRGVREDDTVTTYDHRGERSLPSAIYKEHPWCDWERPPSPMSEASLGPVAAAPPRPPSELSVEERLARLSARLLEYAVKNNINTEKQPCHPDHVKDPAVKALILDRGDSYHLYREEEETRGPMHIEYDFDPDDETIAPASRLLLWEAIEKGLKIRFGQTTPEQRKLLEQRFP